MVTGRPSIASKMPTKSCFWNGSSSARAALRPASSSARIIFRMATIRWSPKNMCSVRHRPMPSAPNDAGPGRVFGRVGVGADLQRADLVGPRHQGREVARDRRVDGRHLADHHVAGRAVDRDEVAGLDRLAVDRDLTRPSRRSRWRRSRRRRACPSRGRRRPRGWPCRRWRSGCPWPGACRPRPPGWSPCAPAGSDRSGCSA